MDSVMFSAHMKCYVKAFCSTYIFCADGPVFVIITQNLCCELTGMQVAPVIFNSYIKVPNKIHKD